MTAASPSLSLLPLDVSHLDELAAAVCALAATSAATMWWVKQDYGRGDAERFLQSVEVARSRQTGDTFVIQDAQGRLVGLANAKNVDWVHGCFQAGYWLTPPARGRGLATQAVRELARWGRLRGMQRMELVIGEHNAASRAVAERAGAQLEGILHKRLLVNGHRLNAALYALT